MIRAPVQTIHILGGGIAGLACAYYAKQKSPQSRVILYEAAARPGGRAFSCRDKGWNIELDNAAHGILGANREVLRFYRGKENVRRIPFYDFADKKLSCNPFRFCRHILLSVFNTPAEKISARCLWRVASALFPFMPRQTRLFYSQNNLTPDLIASFLPYVDELKTGWKLQQAVGEKQIEKLCFNRGEILVGKNDKIVSALDSRAYQRIFGGEVFDYNRIVNVFYRVSTRLWLPGEKGVLGLVNAKADWIFAGKNTLVVTISDFHGEIGDKTEFARRIWLEINALRNQTPFFLPDYRIRDYKYATIAQDKKNNAKRPQNCRTKYTNMVLAGDWTLKNYPCCLNGAVLSARRAVKALF